MLFLASVCLVVMSTKRVRLLPILRVRPRFLTTDEVVPYTRIYNPRGNVDAPCSSSSNPSRHLVLKAQVMSLSQTSVTLDRAFPEHGFTTPTIPFAYCIYALGSRMPIPIDLWSHDPNAVICQPGKTALSGDCEGERPGGVCCSGKGRCDAEYDGSKPQAIEWLKRCQERITRAGSVLCVGGGALGIRESYYSDFGTSNANGVG